MKSLFILAPLLLTACQSAGPKNIDLPFDSVNATKPGTVLHQSSEELGDGFYAVRKSIVNPAGHWEGLRHNSFIYYGKAEICECSQFDTVISPDGKYVVYHSHANNRLELYNTDTNQTSALSEIYIGYPESAAWGLETGLATIYFWEDTGIGIKERKILLE